MTQLLLLLLTLQTTPALPHAHQGMGFDQQHTTHHFVLERGGGTIEVTAHDRADDVTVKQIRAHLRHITTAFANGDFSLPLFIHDKAPDGVATLKARRHSLTYRFEELPSGGKVVIRTSEPPALEALHQFLRFQIREHRTGDPLEPR
jgi:hypothetical protein